MKLAGLAILLVALVASGIHPHDRATWWMEVAPVLAALPVLLATYQRFPLTGLLYGLIALHALVLILGGAYTYARVPLGYWLQDWLGLERNPYDRIGHLMQGFVPALIAREILLRGGYVAGRRMAAFLSVCVALAISEQFLGSQGDPWDTQADMFCALVGAIASVTLLPRVQDAQIRALNSRPVRLL